MPQVDSLPYAIDCLELILLPTADRIASDFERHSRNSILDPQLHALLCRMGTVCRDFHSHATQILASAPRKIREAIGSTT